MTADQFADLLPTLPDEALNSLQATFDRIEEAESSTALLRSELAGQLQLLQEAAR